MIQLHPDCLVFRTEDGELIPCSAETVTIELIGEASAALDPEMVREAAAAVLHYFKEELGRDTVSVEEFSEALERALRGFGFNVVTNAVDRGAARGGANLLELARAADNFELGFFKGLREEFDRQASSSTESVRFWGLRPCVKRMIRAKRWSHRCELFSDQVVEYLRQCLSAQTAGPGRSLVVR